MCAALRRMPMLLACLSVVSGYGFAGLGSPIETRTPYDAFLLDPTRAQKCGFLCAGTPSACAEMQDKNLIAQSVPKNELGNKWFLTTFQVDRVCRGMDVPPVIRVAYSWPQGKRQHAIAAPAADKGRFLLLLERVTDNLFLLPASGGELCLAPTMPLPPQTVPAEGAQAPEQLKGDLLDLELAGAAASGHESVVVGVILSTRYWRVEAPRLRAGIANLRQATNQDIAALALVWLISRGDIEALAAVQSYYERPPLLSPKVALFVDIPSAISTHQRDPQALPELYALCHNKDADLKRSAYYALRMMALPNSGAIFAEGLQDEDLKVRYHCLMGLAEITDRRNPEWTMIGSAYHANPEPLTTKWRSWWEESGKRLYPSIETVLKEYERPKPDANEKPRPASLQPSQKPPEATVATPESSRRWCSGNCLLMIVSGFCIVAGLVLYWTLRPRKHNEGKAA